ncbi:MAG: cytochrome-c peroxidase [Bacteroidetes bacterium]|jgi:cytochrome c peroxidase|nr:cytochrome-c peroxidase [Bacteroidota bacterium]MDF2453212.1 cytochrome-c peroxidase [Bacteroidota bacterium]
MATEQLFVAPENWPETTYDFSKNPLTLQKVELGRKLFYDPILSKNNSISCASCHSQYSAFTHVDHDLSHGIEDRIGTRNSPTLMNLAWHKSFMWDGAINHLDVQALGPISHPDEMGEKIENVVLKLQQSKKYPALFYKAFKDSLITGEHLLKSISQFMLTLVCSNTKYDSVMRKQTQFTTQERNGYMLFQKNCGSCHTEPLFTNLEFENNGLAVDPTLNDSGRMKVTGNKKDSLKFKVPTLRNIEFSYPYMHDGRFKRLSDVLKHYTSSVLQSPTLSAHLQTPVVLSSNEKVDLTAFLLTLSDKSFLFNPKYSFSK